MRQVFRVDRRTHRRLIEPISNVPHLKTVLLARQKNFFDSLLNWHKFEVRYLAKLFEKDNRTLMGSTLGSLSLVFNNDVVSAKDIKSFMKYEESSSDCLWQEAIVVELMFWQEDQTILDGCSTTELEEISEYESINYSDRVQRSTPNKPN